MIDKLNGYIFLIQDDLLKKINTIWDKIIADIEKECDSEHFYTKEFLKTKIKSHGDEVTDFYDKKIPKVESNHTCLAVLTLDSAFRKQDSYYLQVFLKECKYIEKKVMRHVNDSLNDFSSSSSFDESDEE